MLLYENYADKGTWNLAKLKFIGRYYSFGRVVAAE